MQEKFLSQYLNDVTASAPFDVEVKTQEGFLYVRSEDHGKLGLFGELLRTHDIVALSDNPEELMLLPDEWSTEFKGRMTDMLPTLKAEWEQRNGLAAAQGGTAHTSGTQSVQSIIDTLAGIIGSKTCNYIIETVGNNVRVNLEEEDGLVIDALEEALRDFEINYEKQNQGTSVIITLVEPSRLPADFGEFFLDVYEDMHRSSQEKDAADAGVGSEAGVEEPHVAALKAAVKDIMGNVHLRGAKNEVEYTVLGAGQGECVGIYVYNDLIAQIVHGAFSSAGLTARLGLIERQGQGAYLIQLFIPAGVSLESVAPQITKHIEEFAPIMMLGADPATESTSYAGGPSAAAAAAAAAPYKAPVAPQDNSQAILEQMVLIANCDKRNLSIRVERGRCFLKGPPDTLTNLQTLFGRNEIYADLLKDEELMLKQAEWPVVDWEVLAKLMSTYPGNQGATGGRAVSPSDEMSDEEEPEAIVLTSDMFQRFKTLLQKICAPCAPYSVTILYTVPGIKVVALNPTVKLAVLDFLSEHDMDVKRKHLRHEEGVTILTTSALKAFLEKDINELEVQFKRVYTEASQCIRLKGKFQKILGNTNGREMEVMFTKGGEIQVIMESGNMRSLKLLENHLSELGSRP
jgi:hypothetical protein